MSFLQPSQVNSNLGGNPRIVGGHDVIPSPRYDFVSRIYMEGQFGCTGIHYNADTVITAAHCAQLPAESYKVETNRFNLTLTPEQEGSNVYKVKKVIPHPNYSPETELNDIAILKLDTYGYGSKTYVDLDSGSIGNQVGLNMTAIGWGRTWFEGPTPDILQEVQIPIISYEQCSKYNDVLFKVDPKLEVCAGSNNSFQGPCHGDSGGPLGIFKYNRFTLVGITDWGLFCAVPYYGGVFARVSAFVNWIKENAK
jgi:trypsin